MIILFCAVLIVMISAKYARPIDAGSNDVYGYPSNSFHENFGNLISLLSDSNNSDEEFRMPTSPLQLVEFSMLTKIQPTTAPTTTPSKNRKNGSTSLNQQTAVNASLARQNSKNIESSSQKSNLTSALSTTTDKSKNVTMLQPKGILDLLMPPPRVKSFKLFFDNFRKLLSVTF